MDMFGGFMGFPLTRFKHIPMLYFYYDVCSFNLIGIYFGYIASESGIFPTKIFPTSI